MRSSLLAIGLALTLLVTACQQKTLPVLETPPAHEQFSLHSDILNEQRQLTAYLPPEYHKQPATAYPVIFLLDGGVKEDFPFVANRINAAILAGQMQPVVVIGIENTLRSRDMTPPTQNAQDIEWIPVNGGIEAYTKFIESELMPLVRARYRVNNDSTILGESLAGLVVVNTFFNHNALFNRYIAFDPSLWWADQLLAKQAITVLPTMKLEATELYLGASGTSDIAPHVKTLANALEQMAPKGLHWQYAPHDELKHNNIYHTLLANVLINYFPAITT